VLAEVGPASGVADIAFTAVDVSPGVGESFGGSIPLAKAGSGEVLLAWAMNGEPLPRVHGGPLRVVVPGYIGARSVKWVQRVTARAEPSESYFQAEDYRLLPPGVEAGPGRGIELGPLSMTSAILSPPDGAQVAGTRTEVTGYALTGQGRRVARVDVSADGGRTWVQAKVEDQPSPWAWQLWNATVSVSQGPTDLVARAWDDTGSTQPESPASLWNPAGYANNAWPRIRVHVG